ncbi:MAG TPA: aminoglycoside phosphotransferase, partial [Rhodospirillales bacterium]|nr:aminoglycoside phosphotransferase [Rhodospirillales bacterium]
MQPDRDAVIASFLADHGWDQAHRAPLADDASFRRYERLSRDGRTAVLMDAAPPNEDIRPFQTMANYLRGLGYSAPEIFAASETTGLLLLEDLGDDTFTRVLAAGGDEMALYECAVDVLIDLHRRPTSQVVACRLAIYDSE